MRLRSLILITALFCAGFNVKTSADNENSLEALAHKAVSADSEESTAAIASLREQGPAGLAAFINAHATDLKLLNIDLSEPLPEWNEKSKVLNAALDSIAAQYDARASLLYWYTDLEEAKAAARDEQKPILSLRLLGRLDEDLSCANSRLFRLTLYSNRDVAAYLREHFILHWKSERPVPKVTIDFGDGRKLERTITGNSIHYVLDSNARPLDAIPGLYSPKAFLRALTEAESLVKSYPNRALKERDAFLKQYHATRLKEVSAAMDADFKKQGWPVPVTNMPVADNQQNPPVDREKLLKSLTAEEVSKIARTKSVVVESPLLRRISRNPKLLNPNSEDEAWAAVGRLYYKDTQLDTNSRALIRSKNPDLYGPLNIPAEDALKRTITMLERSIAEDTIRNEYLLHAAIHDWFARGFASSDLEKLNERIYAELFLTPRSDPWLGLMPTDAYTGIEREGVKK